MTLHLQKALKQLTRLWLSRLIIMLQTLGFLSTRPFRTDAKLRLLTKKKRRQCNSFLQKWQIRGSRDLQNSVHTNGLNFGATAAGNSDTMIFYYFFSFIGKFSRPKWIKESLRNCCKLHELHEMRSPEPLICYFCQFFCNVSPEVAICNHNAFSDLPYVME